jgi:hypothetical protein
MKLLLRLWYLTMANVLIGQFAFAQKSPWEVGISVGYGQDQFNRKYYDTELWPGTVTNFKSINSWNASVWAEKSLNQRFSVLARLKYLNNKMEQNSLCQCGYTAGVFFGKNEKYHWGSIGTGVRWYVNPQSQVKIFAEGFVQVDYFVAFVREINYITEVKYNALDHQRVVPTFALATGFKWKRFTLSAEYERNIARTFIRSKKEYGTKTGILRQGFNVKASFTILKGGNP